MQIQVPSVDLVTQYAPLKHELMAVAEKLFTSGQFILGEELKEFENEIAHFTGAKHALGISNGTDALFAALRAFDIGAGDQVLTPSFTFFGTCSAILQTGATPVFADIDPDTFNLSAVKVEEALEKDRDHKIRAIMPVHLYGQIAEIEKIVALGKKRGIPVIEDACQAMGSRRNGKSAGTFGAVGAFSFFPTKNLGALGDAGLITTEDDALLKKILMIRNHGQEKRYYHHILGANLRLDNMQAGFLRIFLRNLERWVEEKRQIAHAYDRAFSKLSPLIISPKVEKENFHSYHQYTIRVASGKRDALAAFLKERGIASAIYYPVPCHAQPVLEKRGTKPSLPETDKVSAEVLSLPVFASMAKEQLQWVIASVEEWAMHV